VPEQTSEKLNRKTYYHRGRISRGNGAKNPRLENTRNTDETTERERNTLYIIKSPADEVRPPADVDWTAARRLGENVPSKISLPSSWRHQQCGRVVRSSSCVDRALGDPSNDEDPYEP